MRTKRYGRLGIAGAVAVIAAGSILLNMNTKVMGAKNEGGAQQVQLASAAFKRGDTVALPANVPLFSNIKDSSVAADLMKIKNYTANGAKLKVNAVKDDWIQSKDEINGEQWLPAWYATKDAASIKPVSPRTFHLRPGSKFYLYPGSATVWDAGPALEKKAFIVAQQGQWYGVSLAPRIWNADFYSFRPSMQWIQAKDVSQQEDIPDGWMKSESSLSTGQVRHLTDILIHKGDTERQIAKRLGEPDWTEHSPNLSQTGDPMRIGETWRYEHEDGQVLLTFTPEGKLERMHWNLPQNGSNPGKVSAETERSDRYEFTSRMDGKALAATLPWEPVWVNQGDINYTFLQAGNEDVLLIKGDDGGFSGFYHEGSVYALDRHTGKKLWQINTGFGMFLTKLDASREYVTLYADYDPAERDYVHRIRHIRLKDGKVMWERTAKQGFEGNTVTAAANVVVVEDQVQSDGKKARTTVLNAKNGKTLWTLNLSGEYRLLNEGADDPYVLYWNKNKLVAAEPYTGKVVWSKPAKKSTIDDPQHDPYFDGIQRLDPFAAASQERWMLLDDQWVLIDLKTGEEQAKFAARNGQRFEVLNDGRLLIRENQNGQNYGDVHDYSTTLFDPKSNKKLWAIEGKFDRGLVEGNRLYGVLNGFPAALDYDSGSVVWNVEEEGVAIPMLLNQGSYVLAGDQLLLPRGDDLLVLDKNTGKIGGRIHDIVMGTPEHRDRDAKNGTMNRIGDDIYIGSANGRFGLYSADTLSANISR
ncbi:PQQ-binding-like beta-propeller repeat protein [Paenibacillus sp. FSL W8-0426]|uniref:outer membrane protein assembly factor BamB family protein n=1 Tax=Paenibacillus sp. FSL W8-0426 TaxID=2921714 RepID=UPI0030D7D3F6